MNLSTLIVLSILISIIVIAIITIYKDKKNGKSSCGKDCGGCGNHSLCQNSTSLYKEYKESDC